MDLAITVQILDEAVCISLHSNVLGKVFYPSLLTTTYGQIGNIELFSHGMATGQSEDKP